MSALKVLSLHQPWASFLFLTRPGEDRPVKTFETRPGPPNGDMRPDGVRAGVGGCSVNRGEVICIASTIERPVSVGGWFARRQGYEWCVQRDVTKPGDLFASHETLWLPLGVLLGTVRVVDAYPMIDAELGWQGDGDTPHQAVLVDRWKDTLTLVSPDDERDISDQLEYGDWTPGRWAIELADPTPTTQRCPLCMGDEHGVWGVDQDGEDAGWVQCFVCDGLAACPPLSVSGLQGVWRLTPERLRAAA